MKDHLKLARKEFPKHGAELIQEHNGTQTWLMPWGARKIISRSTAMRHVREVIEELAAHSDPFKNFVSREAPAISRPRATRHFADRAALMGEQDNVVPDEIRLACVSPSETRWCERTGSYAYLRGRIAVIAAPVESGTELLTIFWTEKHMWDKNPRPNREGTYA